MSIHYRKHLHWEDMYIPDADGCKYICAVMSDPCMIYAIKTNYSAIHVYRKHLHSEEDMYIPDADGCKYICAVLSDPES